MGFLPIGLGFEGRETKTDLLKSVFSEENLPPTAEVVRSTNVGSVPIGFFGWVGFSDGFGQPYM